MNSWNKLLHWALPAAALLAGNPAQAQTLVNPVGTDLKPAYFSGTTQPGVLNTGTDVISLPNGERLQAMVWDNGSGAVTLSYSRFKVSSGLFLIAGSERTRDVFANGGFKYSDPDVAMSFNKNGILFANVVYLASDASGAQTWRNIYQYDYATQLFTLVSNANSPRALGVKSIPNVLGFSPATVVRVHRSPNIDANATGETSIVWQESSVETAQVTTVSASYPPPGKVDIIEDLAFSESFMTGATIDGPVYCGNRGVPISATLGTTGGRVIFTQTLTPDVAVAPDGRTWVCYIVSGAIPGSSPVAAGLSLVVRQVAFDFCAVTQTVAAQVWPTTSTAPPRIAAPANLAFRQEAQVVQAAASGGCSSADWFIYNYSASAVPGAPRTDPTVVNSGYTKFVADAPVVTYLGGEAPGTASNQYVVSWTGTGYQIAGTDVWARLMQSGKPVVVPGSFSRVNTLNTGNQGTPSVAARYGGDKSATAHLFFNAATADLGYKFTATPVGGALARPANPSPGTGSVAAPAPTDARALSAYPNPSGGTVALRLALRPAETALRLQLTDGSGRVLDTLTLPAATETPAGTVENTPPPYIRLLAASVAHGRQLPAEADDQPAQRNPAAGPQVRPVPLPVSFRY